MSISPRQRRCDDPGAAKSRGSSVSFLLERRQLRAVIGDENREQAGGLGRARILADEVLAAGRLKEGLAGLLDLGRARHGVLRADLARQDIGHHAAGVMMADRLAAGWAMAAMR